MSDARRLLGRLTWIVGLFWVLWALGLGRLIEVQAGVRLPALPIVPGIVLLFLGRAISRRSGRLSPPDEPEVETRPASSRPSPVSRPATPPRRPPRPSSIPEPEGQAMSEAMAEALQEMEEEMALDREEPMARKTSAEMVAEARQRYGRRPSSGS